MLVRKGTEGESMTIEPAALSTTVAPSPPATELAAVVGIATYNERENLATLIEEIRRIVPQVDILVTDDNSPDGTGALADELAKNDPRIHVLHRSGKLGLGTAILAEMHWAMEHGYGVFVTMDADFSHHPRYLPALLAGTSEHDIVIGSRFIPGGGTVNWPWSRQFMSWGVNTLVRTLMRIKARDASGGFRAYRVDLLRSTNLEDFYSKGYSFQEEMLLRCKLAGARIVESPIVFEDRRLGKTKANLPEIVRSISILVYLGLRNAVGLGPKPKK
jgi:dolichol-phosphate mannosyltransferase